MTKPILAVVVLMTAFASPTFAAGAKDVVGVLTPPTRNAIPGDTEEMNDRELRIRRNMETNGTPYGNGEPSKASAAGGCHTNACRTACKVNHPNNFGAFNQCLWQTGR